MVVCGVGLWRDCIFKEELSECLGASRLFFLGHLLIKNNWCNLVALYWLHKDQKSLVGLRTEIEINVGVCYKVGVILRSKFERYFFLF